MNHFITILSLLILISCESIGQEYDSPPGYDLNNPKVYKMPDKHNLVEISGHAFYKGNKDTIYVEQDEKGAVYTLVLKDEGKVDFVRESVFKARGDFEDIAILNETVIMMRSMGRFYTFEYDQLQNERIKPYSVWKRMSPDGEYESLYADNETNKVYLLCKECDVDDGKDEISGYIYNWKEEELKPAGEFKIDTKKIIEKSYRKDKKKRFKPSAMTFNKNTGEWYIISSINKVLVTVDQDWQVKRVYNIDPEIYIQPEGLAFDNEHNLYISSEGNKTHRGRIFVYPYQKQD